MIEFVLSEWRCYHPVICSKLYIIEPLHSTFQLHSTHLFVCTAEAPEHQSEQWPPEKWKNENVAIRSDTYTSCHIGQLASIFMSEPAVRRACSLAQAVPMRLGSYRLWHAEVNTGIHCHESILSMLDHATRWLFWLKKGRQLFNACEKLTRKQFFLPI